MNTFRRAKTSFSDPDYTPTVYQFETVEELLALEEVQWANERAGAEFVLSGNHLMVLYDGGFEWWVVGLIGKPELVDLPKWKGPKILVERRVDVPNDNFDGLWSELVTEVVTDEILSICGDQITLKDGTVATRVKR
jgi:hypothetical protein